MHYIIQFKNVPKYGVIFILVLCASLTNALHGNKSKETIEQMNYEMEIIKEAMKLQEIILEDNKIEIDELRQSVNIMIEQSAFIDQMKNDVGFLTNEVSNLKLTKEDVGDEQSSEENEKKSNLFKSIANDMQILWNAMKRQEFKLQDNSKELDKVVHTMKKQKIANND